MSVPEPHGPLEQVFPDVWFVRGQIRMPLALPLKISRAMTVVRTPSGGLVLFNSVQLSEAGLAELDALGTVQATVRLAGFHGRDDRFYRERYGAKVLAVKGQRYLAGFPKDPANTPAYLEPDAWLTADSELPIPGASLHVFNTSRPPEAVCLLPRQGGVLITGDSLQNMAGPDEFTNWLAKVFGRIFGFWKPYNIGPGWLRAAKPTPADVQSVLTLDFEHVLPAHGTPVIGGAREKYRPSLEKLG